MRNNNQRGILMLYRFVSRFAVLVLSSFFITACTSVPEGIQPVNNFDKQQYLGTWYEIARLDHSFERGLSHVSANYSVRQDGGIKVVNKGYNHDENEWTEAIGKAYFVGDESRGHLKVSFFGPFYASYVIAELDPNYQYALVTGPDTDFLWILSRTPQLPQKTIDKLVNKAKSAGFVVNDLIFVDQLEKP
jgi:apolipoprotein D and lipocalin family protein